jgi:predicted permease
MPEIPDWKKEIAKRLASLELPSGREAEIVEEMAAHLSEDYRRLLDSGASADEAREIALEGLDGRPALDDALRRVERPARDAVALGTPATGAAADLGRDLRFALRTLLRSPGFTALAVASLALGIGGNTAMFRVVSAALLRPLPYPQPERLVEAANSGYYPAGGVVALQRESRTMDLAGYVPELELNLTGRGEPWRLKGSAVSANLFDVLGVRMELGRAFRAGEDEAGRDNLVILSHELWADRFAGDPAIAGRVVTLGGVERTVVGVAPRGFAFPDAAARFWIPLHLDPRDPSAYWAQAFMPVVGRLRNGVTLGQARQEIRALSLRMLRQFPYTMGRDWAAGMTVTPLREFLTGGIRTRLLVLQCAAGLVLLIACANVAGLLLARAASRQKEMALRVALGASRARIVRQLLTESLVLALAGGGLGAALAYDAESGSGWPMLAFALGLSLATGLIFGLVPALIASRQDLALAIRTGGQRAGGRARLRSALIVGEVATAVVLAVGAGLLIRSLWKLSRVDPGFRPEHVLTLRVSPNESLCRERASCIALYSELLRRTRDLPGVEEAAASNTLPLAAGFPAAPVNVEGQPYVPAEHTAPMFWAGAVTPGYFRLLGIPIQAGRPLDARDTDRAAPVVVVTAATARRYWPGESAVGKHIQLVWENRWRTVVGVAADVRQFDLADRAPEFIQGALYMPYAQSQDSTRELPAAMELIVRTAGDPAQVVGAIRGLVRRLNADVPVDDVRSLVSLVSDATRQPRSMMWLFVGFAAVALALAAVGTYGVVSYSAAQRTFEIGMRVALGAERRNIFGLVLGQSLRLVTAGLGLGIAAALGLTRLLAAFLYGTGTADPLTLASVCGLLLAVGLLAGYVPARKASAIDPLRALRMD